MESPESAVPSDGEQPRPGLIAAFAIATCVLLMLVVLGIYRFIGGFNTISEETAKWNDFGVYFGGVLGPVLSALTLAAVVYTLVLQMRQLAASQKEKTLLQGRLDAAAGVQRDMADGLKKQLETSREQSSIATFFEMSKLHHDLVSRMQAASGQTLMNGRAAIEVMYLQDFKDAYQKVKENFGGSLAELDAAAFNTFYESQGCRYGHYLRNCREARGGLIASQRSMSVSTRLAAKLAALKVSRRAACLEFGFRR